jgi:phosphoribosylformylglycinamidine synthase I
LGEEMTGVKPQALVLTGYGINCDYETAHACALAGFQPERIHLNDVLEKPSCLGRYRLIVFPGGFSFGDDLGSGVAFASKVRFSVSQNGQRLFDALMGFVERGRLVLGVCNGFQILARLGIVPAVKSLYGLQQATLAPNAEGYFIDRWVRLSVETQSNSVFTKNITSLRLPVRHGEGRFVAKDSEMLREIEEKRLVSLRYCDDQNRPANRFPLNPNGSENAIAGVCDPSGRILGLMPHPEAAVSIYQYPDWARKKQNALRRNIPFSEEGEGIVLFKNAYEYAKGS